MTMLLVGCEHGLVGLDAGPGVTFEVVVQEPPGQGRLVVRVEPLLAGPSRGAGSDRQLLGDVGPKSPDERLVDTRRAAHAETASTVSSWSRRDLTARTKGERRARRSGPVSKRAGSRGVDRDGEGGCPRHRSRGVRGSVRTVADHHDGDVPRTLLPGFL